MKEYVWAVRRMVLEPGCEGHPNAEFPSNQYIFAERGERLEVVEREDSKYGKLYTKNKDGRVLNTAWLEIQHEPVVEVGNGE